MKKLILLLFFPLYVTAQIQMSQVSGLIPKLNSKQDSITRGTGFLKRTGLVWSYDPSTYLTTETDPTIYSWAKASIKPSYSWSEIASRPTLLSQFTNDLGNYGGWITGINSSMVTSALGYTPYSSSNPSGYISSYSETDPIFVASQAHNITSTDITHLSNLSGSNSGDETLTTIKSKLGITTLSGSNTGDNAVNSLYSGLVSNATHTGDVTGSTALTLATVNSNIGTYNNITINAKGLATAGSNVSYLTGITSGQVTTALGYTPLSNATSFRTVNSVSVVGSGDISINPFPGFGTGNGAVWGYSAHPTTIVGYGITDAVNGSGLTTNYIPKWNGSNFVNSLISDDGTKAGVGVVRTENFKFAVKTDLDLAFSGIGKRIGIFTGNNTDLNGIQLGYTTDGGGIIAPATESGAVNYLSFWTYNGGWGERVKILKTGELNILSTTASTSPTTGALFVGGGVGADHVRANNFYGSASGLTNLPINLTTNNTSGAATYTQATNTLNVPNYTFSGSGKITVTNTTQADMTGTTVNDGSITTLGGLAAAKNIEAGGDITAYGNMSATNLRGTTFSTTTSGLVGCSSVSITNEMFTQVGEIKTFSFRASIVVTSSSLVSFYINLPITATTTTFTSTNNSAYTGMTQHVNYYSYTAALMQYTFASNGTYPILDCTITYK